MKPNFLHRLSVAALSATAIAGCAEPEISKVLADYCDYMIDECHGNDKYQTKKQCDRYHKDLLNSNTEGDTGKCSSDIEEFFISLMENQMNHTCDFTFFQSVLDEEDGRMQNATKGILQCFDEKNVTIDYVTFIGSL